MKTVKIFCALCFAAVSVLCGGCIAEGVHQYELSQEVMNETNPAFARTNQNPNQDLIVYSSPEIYSYEDFLHDMKFICDAHPAQVQAVKLCDTPDGRGVYDIIFGDANGANQVLIFGAIHGREYITVQVVMRQLCEILDALDSDTYREKPAAELLQGLTIHFVPNANPDGVAISQFGLLGVNDTALRKNVAGISGGNTEQWTANARGVDLNKNFDSSTPEPEVAALIRLMQDYNIKRAISYRTCGAKIYAGSDESKRFAAEISAATNYPLADSVDGYAAWAVEKLGVPAITVEVGAESGNAVNPVPQYRFDGIWVRNKDVVCATATALKEAEQLTRPTP